MGEMAVMEEGKAAPVNDCYHTKFLLLLSPKPSILFFTPLCPGLYCHYKYNPFCVLFIILYFIGPSCQKLSFDVALIRFSVFFSSRLIKASYPDISKGYLATVVL